MTTEQEPTASLTITLRIADLIRYHTFSITPDGSYSWLSLLPPCQTIPADGFLPPLYQGIDDIDERIKAAHFTVTFERLANAPIRVINKATLESVSISRDGKMGGQYSIEDATDKWWEDRPTVEWPTLPHEDEPIAIFTADEDWYYFQGDYTGEYYMSKEPTKDTAKQEGVYMAHWKIHRKCIELTVEGQMRYEMDTEEGEKQP